MLIKDFYTLPQIPHIFFPFFPLIHQNFAEVVLGVNAMGKKITSSNEPKYHPLDDGQHLELEKDSSWLEMAGQNHPSNLFLSISSSLTSCTSRNTSTGGVCWLVYRREKRKQPLGTLSCLTSLWDSQIPPLWSIMFSPIFPKWQPWESCRKHPRPPHLCRQLL